MAELLVDAGPLRVLLVPAVGSLCAQISQWNRPTHAGIPRTGPNKQKRPP
jgi:hypothetical protein